MLKISSLLMESKRITGVFEGLNGNFTGSVFADDSTIMVDGVAGKIVGQLEVSNLMQRQQHKVYWQQVHYKLKL